MKMFSLLFAAFWAFLRVSLTVALFSLSALHAQDSSNMKRINFDLLTAAADADKPLFLRYGLWGGAQWNNQNANFSHARGFETTSPNIFGQQNQLQILISPSATFGAMVEFPLAGRLGIGLRAAYSLLWGDFTQQETFTYRLSNNQITSGILEHRFSARLGSVLLEPVATYRILDALTLHAGLQVGYAPAPTFSSQTVVLGNAPSFADGSRARDVVVDKALPRSASFTDDIALSLMGGLSYEIPLNATGTVLFAPELWYAYPLRNIPADLVKPDGNAGEWRISSLRLAASLRWSPFRTIRPELTPDLQEKIQELKRYDSAVTVEKVRNEQRLRQVDSTNRVITARMEEMKKLGVIARINRIVGISASGVETESPKLHVEEFRATVHHQLLPFIQFEENGVKLPIRYRALNGAERGTFLLQSLAEKTPLEAYRHILNIIGKRMSEAPSGVLYLSASAASSEQQVPQSAERRALAVSGYLQDVWKIAEKRIIIGKPNLTKQGAEAHRVELSANIPDILAPLAFDAVRREVRPEKIRIESEISVGSGLKQWRVEARQFNENEDVLLKEFQGGTEPTSLTAASRIEWALSDEPRTVPQSVQDVVVQLTVTDTKNINTESPLITLPVELQNILQKEAKGEIKPMQCAVIAGFVNNLPDEGSMLLLRSFVRSVPAIQTIVLRYTNEKGKTHAQGLLKALGFVEGTNVRLRQVAPFTNNLPETPDIKMYKDAVEMEIR